MSKAPNLHLFSSLIGIAPTPFLPLMWPSINSNVRGFLTINDLAFCLPADRSCDTSV